MIRATLAHHYKETNMTNVNHNILGPDTLSALAALAANMVKDCQAVAAVETSADMIPALSNVVGRGHEAGGVGRRDVARKVLAGATKADIAKLMNADSGTRGGKALAGHIMKGLRALAAKDNDSGRTIKAWLGDDTLKFDSTAKQFHWAPKSQRESLKTRLVALIGEGSDEELLARVEGLVNKAAAAVKAAENSEAKAKRLAAELAEAKAALQAKPGRKASSKAA